MKSFCLKTNNNDILDYLLDRIRDLDFPDLAYSKNKFKIYQNVMIHYQGKDKNDFISFLSELITEVIIEFYEEKIIKRMLNYNYFYFDDYERVKILENCFEIMESEEYEQSTKREEMIQDEITSYVTENRAVVLDGFVYFRLKKYFSYLDEIIDTAVNKFIIEKEYNEFISLLRIYVDSKDTEYDLLHLIYINGESILLDKEKNLVSASDNIFNAKYLSDISFSSNDFTLNTLLTLLPEKIEIHLIGLEDEFINTLQLIFDGRVSICKDCNICRTYRLLEHAKID